MKKVFFLLLAIFLTSTLCSCATSRQCRQSVSFNDEEIYIPLESSEGDIMSIAVNHKQGSLNFYISGKYYFYYIDEGNDIDRILAASRMLEDLQKADYVQIKSEKYGLHKKITNLLIFYGDEKTIIQTGGKKRTKR